MKICPYCANEIQDAAIKCQYCGERFQVMSIALPAALVPNSLSEGLVSRFEPKSSVSDSATTTRNHPQTPDAFFRALRIIGILLFVGMTVIGVSTGMYALAIAMPLAAIVFWRMSYLGYRLGDKFREFTAPEMFFSVGLIDTFVSKLLFMYGPQAAGVACVGGGLAVAAFVLSSVLWASVAGHQNAAPSTQVAATTQSDNSTPGEVASVPIASPAVGPSSPEPTATNPTPQSSDAETTSVDPSTDAVATRVSRPTPPADIPELETAAQEALEGGRTVRWHSALQPLSGFVVVSTEQSYPDKVCRSYRFTVVNIDRPLAATDRTACKVAGGGWKSTGSNDRSLTG